MHRLVLAALVTFGAVAASAQPPTDPWHAKGREIYERAVEIPTVQGRGKMGELTSYLREQFGAAGINDVRVMEHGGTQSMIVRWRAERPSGRKAILILAHMDVVEARREDWERDPFELIEEEGYFYGRGTADNKLGVVSVTTALLRLRAQGFRPDRDIIVLFTGDEETAQEGAEKAASEWLDLSTIEYGLNADGGGGAFLRDGTNAGFQFVTSEKIYQSFTFTARNRGGHSSRPRADNAIYDLTRALQRLEAHRFEPRLNETTRAYFAERAKTADAALAGAIRRWLADPTDADAADAVEASETELGLTRTRCVATRLEAGHADNALPQRATATVNCRIFPDEDPAAVLGVLRALAQPSGVVVEPIEQARPTPASPLRQDVLQAFTAAVHVRHPASPIIPTMLTGATDALFFRARGVPVYGVAGNWGVYPDDARAHGLNERVPVRAFYQSIDHWSDLIRTLAGPERRRRRR
ncbi:M20/M25/M40 family metallo-hydrolase [Allosphingosinicella sp.]|jgi:acetylornithine deacetylase/succinyl-diaminopimelate desuccinylase-like protein|uniref:M20/M25/M40 family metallo-hydrolase n=1 Tax=Allosphingosinicella sp. TaxID=2823234 RepID=UPI002F11DA77